jgi:hypothetical protein
MSTGFSASVETFRSHGAGLQAVSTNPDGTATPDC